jgi:hypothetical protein
VPLVEPPGLDYLPVRFRASPVSALTKTYSAIFWGSASVELRISCVFDYVDPREIALCAYAKLPQPPVDLYRLRYQNEPRKIGTYPNRS